MTQPKQPEMVDHPRHYNTHPSGVECITVVEHMSFNIGNAIKYAWRADEKGNAIEDLEKAAWYLNREIQRRKKLAQTELAPCGHLPHPADYVCPDAPLNTTQENQQ